MTDVGAIYLLERLSFSHVGRNCTVSGGGAIGWI